MLVTCSCLSQFVDVQIIFALRRRLCKGDAAQPQAPRLLQRILPWEERGPSGPGVGCEVGTDPPRLPSAATPPERGFS